MLTIHAALTICFTCSAVARAADKATANTYSDSSPAVSEFQPNAQLRKWRWKYNVKQPLTRSQTRQINNPLKRAQHSHPDEKREVRRKANKTFFWQPKRERNWEYVRDVFDRNAKRRQRSKVRDDQKRAEIHLQTGTRPISRQSVNKKERLQRAKSAPSDEVIQIKRPYDGRLVPHPDGLTNAQYVSQFTEQTNKWMTDHRKRKKARSSDQAPASIPAQMVRPPQLTDDVFDSLPNIVEETDMAL